VEGSCEHGNEPSGSINPVKFLNSYTIDSFSRRVQLYEWVSKQPYKRKVLHKYVRISHRLVNTESMLKIEFSNFLMMT
jgi:hypothetical protein